MWCHDIDHRRIPWTKKRVRKVAKLNNYLLLVSSIRNLGFCLKYLFVSSKILEMNPSIRSISAWSSAMLSVSAEGTFRENSHEKRKLERKKWKDEKETQEGSRWGNSNNRSKELLITIKSIELSFDNWSRPSCPRISHATR